MLSCGTYAALLVTVKAVTQRGTESMLNTTTYMVIKIKNGNML
jgi:hypothetical protein